MVEGGGEGWRQKGVEGEAAGQVGFGNGVLLVFYKLKKTMIDVNFNHTTFFVRYFYKFICFRSPGR